jgi:hypothetical protein
MDRDDLLGCISGVLRDLATLSKGPAVETTHHFLAAINRDLHAGSVWPTHSSRYVVAQRSPSWSKRRKQNKTKQSRQRSEPHIRSRRLYWVVRTLEPSPDMSSTFLLSFHCVGRGL